MKTSRNYLLALRLSLLACVLPLSIGSTSALADPPAATSAEEALAKENYLKNYIRPDTIRRSFHTAEGMWVDCVDVNRQPGMLAPDMAGKTVEQPPPPPARHDDRARVLPHGAQLAVLDTELHANEADENGVVRRCEEGTIPIRRRTPEELSRFPNLRDMFSKGRGHPFKSGSNSPSPKFYEHAGSSQSVTNWGMQFFMNIWSPTTNSSDHSISQMWVLNSAVTDWRRQDGPSIRASSATTDRTFLSTGRITATTHRRFRKRRLLRSGLRRVRADQQYGNAWWYL